MNKVRPGTICRHKECRVPYRLHDEEDESCPDGSGRRFKMRPPRLAASQSFSEDEIKIADFILTGIKRGGDVRRVLRHDAFPGFAQKVQSMKKQVERARELRKEQGFDD